MMSERTDLTIDHQTWNRVALRRARPDGTEMGKLVYMESPAGPQNIRIVLTEVAEPYRRTGIAGGPLPPPHHRLSGWLIDSGPRNEAAEALYQFFKNERAEEFAVHANPTARLHRLLPTGGVMHLQYRGRYPDADASVVHKTYARAANDLAGGQHRLVNTTVATAITANAPADPDLRQHQDALRAHKTAVDDADDLLRPDDRARPARWLGDLDGLHLTASQVPSGV